MITLQVHVIVTNTTTVKMIMRGGPGRGIEIGQKFIA